MRHEFADGKYTVINDNGKLTALRHGEPWVRDLVGDNLVYWMLVEVDTLKAVNQELLEALKYHQEQTRPIERTRAAIARAEGQA